MVQVSDFVEYNLKCEPGLLDLEIKVKGGYSLSYRKEEYTKVTRFITNMYKGQEDYMTFRDDEFIYPKVEGCIVDYELVRCKCLRLHYGNWYKVDYLRVNDDVCEYTIRNDDNIKFVYIRKVGRVFEISSIELRENKLIVESCKRFSGINRKEFDVNV